MSQEDIQAEIKLLKQQIEEMNKALEEKNKALEKKNKALEEKNKALEEKNKALEEKNKALEGKDKTLKEKEKALEEKDKALEEKDKDLEEKNKTLEKQQNSLAKQDLQSSFHVNINDIQTNLAKNRASLESLVQKELNACSNQDLYTFQEQRAEMESTVLKKYHSINSEKNHSGNESSSTNIDLNTDINSNTNAYSSKHKSLIIKTIDELTNISANDLDEKYKEAYNILHTSEEQKEDALVLELEKNRDDLISFIINRIILDPSMEIFDYNEFQSSLNNIYSLFTVFISKWIQERPIFLKKCLEDIENRRSVKTEFIISFVGARQQIKIALNSFFCGVFNKIFQIILVDKSKRYLSLGFLRRISDCSLNTKSFGPIITKMINHRLPQIVSNSYRVIELLFSTEFVKSLKIFNLDPSADIENNKEIKISIKQKTKGINFGFIIQITEIKKLKKTIFYVKKYHLGSRCDHLYEYIFYSEHSNLISSNVDYLYSELSSAPTPRSSCNHQLDLKEPFIYRLSELLNFSPEVHFFINPYVRDGFYIATKNLSQNDHLFFEFSNTLESKEYLLAKIKDNQFFIQSLLLFGLYSIICLINDLHAHNFGFVLKVNDLNTTVPNNISPTDTQSIDVQSVDIQSVDIQSLGIESLKFIDFSPPEKSKSYNISVSNPLKQNMYICNTKYGILPRLYETNLEENLMSMINTLKFMNKADEERYSSFSKTIKLLI